MILSPPLNQLTVKVNSRYLITTTTAKRTRELNERRETTLLDQCHSTKPIGEALEEIADGKIEPVVPKEYLG